jgi:phage portal protein BeeE
MWPSWRQGKPLWHIIDYSGYVNEGFNLNSLIYSAVMYKVRAMATAPLRAWTGDVDTPELLPADNPLQQLVARPNFHQSWVEFHSQNVVYLNIAGNAYIWMNKGEQKEREERGLGDSNIPIEMYSLRPDRVFIVPGVVDGTHRIVGYVYTPEGTSAEFTSLGKADRLRMLHEGKAIPIRPEDMMHVKLPNALDPLEGLGYGLSPLSALARNADVDNSVTHFLQLFFRQGVMVPGVLSSDKTLSDPVIARIKRQWKEMYGGYERWSEEVGVLEAGAEYQRIGLTFQEMGFETLDDRNETRILSPFGVPPILTGTRVGLNRSTYSNYKEARQAFWEDTMVPETELFQVDYQFFLANPDLGWFVGFDFSHVPAFQGIRQENQDRFERGWELGAVSRNEYRRALNLSPTEDGDVYRTQPTTIFVPVDSAGAMQIPATTTEDTTSEGSLESDTDDRKALAAFSQALKKKGL